MSIIQDWKDIPNIKIIYVRIEDDEGVIRLCFENGDWVGFESTNFQEAVDFYPENVDMHWSNCINPNNLIGKRIVNVLVPFHTKGSRGDAWVTFRFADGSTYYLASEDRFTPIKFV